jgi:hypothetical protein
VASPYLEATGLFRQRRILSKGRRMGFFAPARARNGLHKHLIYLEFYPGELDEGAG